MKGAPLTITPVLLAVLVVAAVVGAIVAAVASNFGVSGWPGFFLAAFVPVPLASVIRILSEGALRSTQNVPGSVPTPWPFPIRMLAGAVVAGALAFGAANLQGTLPFGALSGALVALLTAVVLTVIFSIVMAMRD